MIGQAFPLFKAGQILRQEMLEAIADHTFRFGELLFKEYADGIVSGCQLTATAKAIHLHEGVLLHQNILYLLKHPLSIPYSPTNSTCVLKIRFLGEQRTENFINYALELFLTEEIAQQKEELELCRFTLQPGAKLRYQYVDFKDRATEYDTINTIYSPFAARNHCTLSLETVQSFAKEALDYGITMPLDQSFCLQAFNAQQPITAEAIAAYLKLRIHFTEEINNFNLYHGLLQLLQDIKNGAVSEHHSVQQRRTIWVD